MKEFDALINIFGSAIEKLREDIFLLAGGIIVLMVIWSGFKYMTTDAETGKKSLLAAIIGLAIVIFSVFIINTVTNFIKTSGDIDQSEFDWNEDWGPPAPPGPIQNP